jgi:hypothetical protein
MGASLFLLWSSVKSLRLVLCSRFGLGVAGLTDEQVWGAKCCLLTLYIRLTTLRWENIAIKILLGYVVISFAIMEILYFGYWCQPFHLYWAVPTPNVQCNAATNHLIMNAVFNLTSDVIMLGVGLPMFLRLNLPWQKKYPLILVFSLGIFVILAAILNKVYSFTQPFGTLWTFWYVRESSTALLVANLPFVWNFWRRIGGFSSVIGGSKRGTTRAATAVDVSPQRGSVPRECEMPEFITTWPLPDEKDGEDGLQRIPSANTRRDQEMSFEEALGISTRPESLPREAPPVKKAETQDAPRRDSSSATYSNTPASLNGPSWSAGSFV